jgi:dTDP-glucose 4,6-dehydratase
VGRHLAADLKAIGEQVVVADVVKSDLEVYRSVPFVEIDIVDPSTLERLSLEPDDVVYNMAAKMLSPIMPRAERHDFFFPVNTDGVRNLLEYMSARGATRLVQFSTDMIYGHTHAQPVTEGHPAVPLGEYGLSKLECERMCEAWRGKGMRISVFRPRLIIGPGRLGILSKLFRLVDAGLPIPMIGAGRNAYQFISVFDCASAARLAWQRGFPQAAYNLGSDDPPPVRELLSRLVREARSRSILLPTPAPLVKLVLMGFDRVNVPLMDPEQFLIADEHCVLSTERAKCDLGWKPLHKDDDMLVAAYREYRAAIDGTEREPEAGAAPRDRH